MGDLPLMFTTKRPASVKRTECRQFQAVFRVINGSFPTNVIAHLHGLSMDLTVGRTVGPTADSPVGWTVGLTVKLCKHWLDSRFNYWSNCGNHWPRYEAENWGDCAPLGKGDLGLHLTQFGRGRAYLHAEFHLDPSNRLAIIHKRYRQDKTDRQTDRQRSDSI